MNSVLGIKYLHLKRRFLINYSRSPTCGSICKKYSVTTLAPHTVESWRHALHKGVYPFIILGEAKSSTSENSGNGTDNNFYK